jgi:glycosyltransferase involved in cell wall biosynthesis
MSGPRKVAILITTYNRPEMLKRMVESLRKSLNGDPNTVIGFVVDDGSDMDITKIIPDFNYIRIEKNRGLANAINIGMDAIEVFEKGHGNFDYVTYVQDDVIFKPNWLMACIVWWEATRIPTANIGLITCHNAPEHPNCGRMYINQTKETIAFLKMTCRATHLFASRSRWKDFGRIPNLTPGIASPKPGHGSLVDWWLVGHPKGKYPQSIESLLIRGEVVLVLPDMVKHIGVKDSTWGNVMNPESESK